MKDPFTGVCCDPLMWCNPHLLIFTCIIVFIAIHHCLKLSCFVLMLLLTIHHHSHKRSYCKVRALTALAPLAQSGIQWVLNSMWVNEPLHGSFSHTSGWHSIPLGCAFIRTWTHTLIFQLEGIFLWILAISILLLYYMGRNVNILVH